MVFKRSSIKINLLILISFLIFVNSCGVKTGEKTSEPEVAKVEGGSCLKQAIADFKSFFKAEAADEQLNSAVLCTQQVFVAFKENIRGEDKSSYTIDEIATFIENNFFKDGQEKFPKNLLSEFMFFKAALFGGNEKVILKTEIDRIIDFFARFKPELIKLNPHMKVIAGHWNFNQPGFSKDPKNEMLFLEAKSQFTLFIAKLSGEFSKIGYEYKIDHLVQFLIEIFKYSKADANVIKTIEQARPFLKKFKHYLIGGADSLKMAEWGKMGLCLKEAYFQALRFKYFIKNLNQDEVAEKWENYLKVALDVAGLIETLLQSKQSQALTNVEISDLFQSLTEFWPQMSLTEDLLNEIGDLKVMLLGESSLGRRGWSQADFAALKKKLPVLFENLSSVFEGMDILRFKKDAQVKMKLGYIDFLKHETNILVAINNLSALIEKSYNLESLRHFLKDLAKGPLKNTFKLPENFDSWFNIVISAKYVLTGNPTSSTTAQDLKHILNIGVRGYLNYVEYDLFLSEQKFESLSFMEALQKLWPKILNTFKAEINLRFDKRINTTELVELVMNLQNENFLKAQIQKESLVSFINALWSHILNKPEDRLRGVSRPGFDLIALNQFAAEFEKWLGAQFQLTEIFSRVPGWPRLELLAEFENKISSEKNDNVKAGLVEMTSVLKQQIPLIHNSQNFLQILVRPSGLYQQIDLTRSNFSRLLSRMIIRSFAKDLPRVNQLEGVYLEEAQFGYDLIKNLGFDLNFLDKTKLDFIKARFAELSLFLSVSDGNRLASFLELHHLVIHLFSGVARAIDVKIDLIKDCLVNSSPVLAEQSLVNEDCALDIYVKNNRSFSGLPQFLNMRSAFNSADLKDYYMSLLKASGHTSNDKKTLFLSHADLFPHIVQYIEMIFARHDLNSDQLLQKDEALNSFPIFKDLLQEMVKSNKQIKEADLPGVFIYLLKYGRPPRKGNTVEELKFLIFIRDKQQINWNINSSRLMVGKIFSYIANPEQ